MSGRTSQTTTTTFSPRRAGTKRSSSTFERKRGVAVPRAAIDNDVSIFNLDSAAEAGVIILLVRIITLGGGKAALSKQLREQIRHVVMMLYIFVYQKKRADTNVFYDAYSLFKYSKISLLSNIAFFVFGSSM